MSASIRKSLCADALIASVYSQFQKIPDPRKLPNTVSISFTDVLMSGFAVFSLKFPSLLKYDQHRDVLDQNLRTLYHINHPPSDTYLRERLDEVDPSYLRSAFKKIFAMLQRGKCLEEFEFLEGHYLLSLDGTGKFSSSTVHCEQCCKKEHKNGSVTYYHQMLGACIVHPQKSNVIPLCPEAIHNTDGFKKNDCERNAAKRFIEHFKREHPHLKVIVLADGIASNSPYIQLLEEHRMKFFLGAKPGDHKFLFSAIETSEESNEYEVLDKDGFLHQFRYVNDVALNKGNPDTRVNFMEYMQTDPKGKETLFSWVTNITINQNNVFQLMRGGRARWKIENETFNTLKNLGYNFEHNYGHGKKHLSTILGFLLMIAFLIDQVQEIACTLFKSAKKRSAAYRVLWENTRVLLQFWPIPSWEWLYQTISKKEYINTA
jgi:hypothetical protein